MICLKQTVLASVMMIAASNLVIAKAKIPIGIREVVAKVYDLPNTDEFKLDNGNYLDLATMHKEFNIAYIFPLYITQDPQLVAFDEKSERYFIVPNKELSGILSAQNVDERSLVQLPFYTKYGGKLVALLMITLLIWGSIPSKKTKVVPTHI